MSTVPLKYPAAKDLPAQGGFAITPADANLAEAARSLWVDGAGTVVVTFADGSGPFTFTLPGGSLLPASVQRVALASTATGIVGLR